MHTLFIFDALIPCHVCFYAANTIVNQYIVFEEVHLIQSTIYMHQFKSHVSL